METMRAESSEEKKKRNKRDQRWRTQTITRVSLTPNFSWVAEPSRELRKLLPLPGGEGWGEGEPLFSLNSYGEEAKQGSSICVRIAQNA